MMQRTFLAPPHRTDYGDAMRYIILCAIIGLFLTATPAASRSLVKEAPGGQCGENRIAVAEKPESCPCCGFTPVGNILYGYPQFTDELKQKINTGHIVLGGCLVPRNAPRWKCSKCGVSF